MSNHDDINLRRDIAMCNAPIYKKIYIESNSVEVS